MNHRRIHRIAENALSQYSWAVAKDAITHPGEMVKNAKRKGTFLAKRFAKMAKGSWQKRGSKRKQTRIGWNSGRRDGRHRNKYINRTVPDADSHNNVSQYPITIKYKKQKNAKFYKIAGNKCIYKNTATLSAISEEGQQQVDVPGNILYDKTAIRALYASAAKFYNATAGLVVAPSGTQPGYGAQSILLEKVNVKLRLLNQALASIELDVYLVHPKNTTSSTRTPRDTWNDGLENISTDTYATANTIFTPFQRPQASKNFNMQWRTLFKKTITLEPGREANFNLNFHPNRIFDMEYTDTFDHFKGITTRWMICTRGTLGDTSNAVGTVGDITLGPSKYIGYQDITYTSRLLTPFPRRYELNGAWDVAVTNLYTVNDESGARIDINV